MGIEYVDLKRDVEIAARAQFKYPESHRHHAYYMGLRHGIEQIGFILFGSTFMADAEAIRMRVYNEAEALREAVKTA